MSTGENSVRHFFSLNEIDKIYIWGINEMDIRELIKIINQNEEAKQFWKKIFKQRYTGWIVKVSWAFEHAGCETCKDSKRRKRVFLKCIFSVSTENGIKFEKEERVFDSFMRSWANISKLFWNKSWLLH